MQILDREKLWRLLNDNVPGDLCDARQLCAWLLEGDISNPVTEVVTREDAEIFLNGMDIWEYPPVKTSAGDAEHSILDLLTGFLQSSMTDRMVIVPNFVLLYNLIRAYIRSRIYFYSNGSEEWQQSLHGARYKRDIEDMRTLLSMFDDLNGGLSLNYFT